MSRLPTVLQAFWWERGYTVRSQRWEMGQGLMNKTVNLRVKGSLKLPHKDTHHMAAHTQDCCRVLLELRLASLHNMRTRSLHVVTAEQIWHTACLSGRTKLLPVCAEQKAQTHSGAAGSLLLLLLWRPFRVTWVSLYFALLLKKILSGYLNYPMMHCISTGSNLFHDDNASLP